MEQSLTGTFSNHVRTSLVILMLILLIYSLLSCEGKAENLPKKLSSTVKESEKRVLKEGLKFALRNLDYTLKKLEATSGEDRISVNDTNSRLKTYREEAHKTLIDLRNVNTENWIEVSRRARRILKETRGLFGPVETKSKSLETGDLQTPDNYD